MILALMVILIPQIGDCKRIQQTEKPIYQNDLNLDPLTLVLTLDLGIVKI